MIYKQTQEKIFSLVGYKPLATQVPVHLDDSRSKQIAGGERGGKSMVDEKELLYQWYVNSIKTDKGALYWLVGSDYESCRGEWEYAVEDFRELELLRDVTKNIDPGELLLKDGTKIITKSAKYPEKIATLAPDGIVICEAAQVDYEVLLRSMTRLAEKRGWLVVGGTFEQEEHVGWFREYYELGQSYNQLGWKSFSLPTWGNLEKFPGGRNDPEILRMEASMPKDRFLERFGGVPCPKTGRVVTEFSNVIHVRPCAFNRDLPVGITVDPGYRGACVVEAIQDYGDYLEIIDEVYLQGVLLKDIITIVKKKEWYDAITHGTIDIAGKQHQGGLEAPVEVWETETKGKIYLRSQKLKNVEDGIDLLRTHLQPHPITGKPGVYFDPKCHGVIAECGGGKSPVDGGGIWMRDKVTLKALERNDHACKTLIYYLLDKYGFSGEIGRLPELKSVGRKLEKTFVRT